MSNIIGFPRIGQNRELKKTLEAFWSNKVNESELEKVSKDLRAKHWSLQKNLDFVCVNDFSLYDNMLDIAYYLGAKPSRFKDLEGLELYFAMARGHKNGAACEMTKWFNTNYHYVVPELSVNDNYKINPNPIIEQYKEAKELGYNIDITSCISKELIKRDENGNLYLDRMIRFAEELGIEKMNFHNLFKTGVPRDNFSGNIDITINDWFKVWNEIEPKVENNEYSIPVRIPQSFTTKEEFEKNPKYYGYCSCKNGSRILVHPNGMLRVCSLMIGTPYGIARYYDNKIVWDDSPTNELRAHKMNEDTPCTNQSKHNKYGKFVPVCVSFKPRQNEMIWKELNWEERRNKVQIVLIHDDKQEQEKISNILRNIKDVELLAVCNNANDGYHKIIELKPTMVFMKYDLDGMNGLNMVETTHNELKEETPIYNMITSNEIKNDEAYKVQDLIGDKFNSMIHETSKERLEGIILDYKEYIKNN